MGRIYFVINPRAKNGYALKVWEKVEDYLKRNERKFNSYLTEYPGHATEITREICISNKEYQKTIVAIGGDGTIHEVMNGAASFSNVEIGFIPAGSGNDFRRGFNIPKDIISGLECILERKVFSSALVDMGEIVDGNGKKSYFINNMGSGFDAWIAKQVNESKMKGFLNRFSLGGLTYAYYVIKEIFTFPLTNIKITIDDQQFYFEKTWFVTVSNQPYYGGGMKIAPTASVIDNQFEITVVSNLHPLKFLLVFGTVFWGGHLRYKEVSTFRGKHIQIVSSEPLTTHADGEYIGTTPVDVRVLHKHIPVVTSKLD